jgi:hypothetical protein
LSKRVTNNAAPTITPTPTWQRGPQGKPSAVWFVVAVIAVVAMAAFVHGMLAF